MVQYGLYKKSKFIYIFSVLTHNASGVFLPTIFTQKKFVQIKFILSIVASILIMVLFADTKSSDTTGETSPYLFLFCILMLYIIFTLSNFLKINKENVMLYYINTHCLFISIFSTIFLSNASAKRLSMMALCFLLYSLYFTIENKVNNAHKFLFRLIFIIIAISPTFIFSSAFNMLIYQP